MKMLYISNANVKSQKANLIQVVSMCHAFSQAGVDTTLVLPEPNFDYKENVLNLKKRFGIPESFKLVHYPQYSHFKKCNKYLDYFCVKKVLDDILPDLIFIRNPIFIKQCIETGVPTIYESHNSLMHNRIMLIDKLWKRVIVKLSRRKNFLKLVVISEALKTFWMNMGIEQDKILALHDGFNSKLFMKTKSRSEARKKLGIDINKKKVVYTGSLYRDRGIENILRLAKDTRFAEFYVIGGPDKNAYYFADIAKQKHINNIYFLGRINHMEIPDYLYAADVLLAIWSNKVPTINYCSPLKVFEYMAAGRIIVAHDYPTIREVLTDNKTAYLTNTESYTNLCDDLKKALFDEYPSKLAEESRSLAFQKKKKKKRAHQILKNISL